MRASQETEPRGWLPPPQFITAIQTMERLMSPQLYFFVSVGFQPGCVGHRGGALYLAATARSTAGRRAAAFADFAQLPLRGPGVPRSGRRLARSAGRLRAFRRLRRFHRRDAGVAHVGVAVAVAQDWRRRRMDLQSLGRGRLLNAFYQGNASGLVFGQLGAAYFIPTVFVPLLLITHVLAFRISVATPGSVGRDGKREPGLNSSTTSVTAPTRRRGRRELTGATP